MSDTLFERLSAALPGVPLLAAEPLAKHTSFRVGGPAEVLICPRNETELTAALAACRAEGIAPKILGGGTNILAPDAGLPGVVISTRGLDTLELIEPCRDGTLPSGSPQANDRPQGDLPVPHTIPRRICLRQIVFVPNAERQVAVPAALSLTPKT